MATVLENIVDMNTLITSEKKRTHLSEATLLRVIDMNLALAQRGEAGNPLMNGAVLPEEEEDLDEPIPFPEPHEVGIPVDEAEIVAAASDEPTE